MTIAAFPLARSKRATTLARQVASCRLERRRDRLEHLLHDERDKLIGYGIAAADVDRDIDRLRDRVLFLVAARPMLETTA